MRIWGSSEMCQEVGVEDGRKRNLLAHRCVCFELSLSLCTYVRGDLMKLLSHIERVLAGAVKERHAASV